MKESIQILKDKAIGQLKSVCGLPVSNVGIKKFFLILMVTAHKTNKQTNKRTEI